jgi:hypothetical protein
MIPVVGKPGNQVGHVCKFFLGPFFSVDSPVVVPVPFPVVPSDLVYGVSLDRSFESYAGKNTVCILEAPAISSKREQNALQASRHQRIWRAGGS